MTARVFTKTYPGFPFNDREIFRYAGCKEPDEGMLSFLEEVKKTLKNSFVYKVCYTRLPVQNEGGMVALNGKPIPSNDLKKALKGAKEMLIFSATVGVEIDRLILKAERISPLTAVFYQAVGAERIETLCNAFCQDVAKEEGVVLFSRFSAGYGDLPLETQKLVFALLSPEKHIGLTLSDACLMSPTKSVTAFVGIDGAGTR